MMWLFIVLVNFSLISFLVSLHPSQSLLSPCPFITAFHPCILLKNKIQKKNQQNIRNKLSKLNWSHIAKSQGLGPLLHPQLRLIETPLGYPVFALCHEDHAAVDLLVQLPHMLQHFIDEVNVVVSQLIALVLSLGGSCIGQPTSFPSLRPTGWALQYCSN